MALHRCRHVPIPPVAATAIIVAGVVTTAVPLHTDVFEDSHGGKVTTAPLHHLHTLSLHDALPIYGTAVVTTPATTIAVVAAGGIGTCRHRCRAIPYQIGRAHV